MAKRIAALLAGGAILIAQLSGTAVAQYAPPPPELGTPSPPGNVYAPPPPPLGTSYPPGGVYAPSPPGNVYAPPPPSGAPFPPRGNVYAPAPPPLSNRPSIAGRPNSQAQGGFAGTVRCESSRGGHQRCEVPTANRAVLLNQRRGQCVQNQSWGYDGRSIWVMAGCGGDFGYGYAYNAALGGYPAQSANGGGYARRLQCESRNYGYQRCDAPTQNRVTLVRQLGGGQCIQNRTWGFDQGAVWVTQGCRAEFAVGYGRESASGNGGPSTGAVIGGAVVAAGLAALLARSGKKAETRSQGSTSAARITGADFSRLGTAQRRSAELCLAEAASQISATGATELNVIRLGDVQTRGDGHAVAVMAEVRNNEGPKMVSIDCTTAAGKVTAINFR